MVPKLEYTLKSLLMSARVKKNSINKVFSSTTRLRQVYSNRKKIRNRRKGRKGQKPRSQPSNRSMRTRAGSRHN